MSQTEKISLSLFLPLPLSVSPPPYLPVHGTPSPIISLTLSLAHPFQGIYHRFNSISVVGRESEEEKEEDDRTGVSFEGGEGKGGGRRGGGGGGHGWSRETFLTNNERRIRVRVDSLENGHGARQDHLTRGDDSRLGGLCYCLALYFDSVSFCFNVVIIFFFTLSLFFSFVFGFTFF